MKTFSLLFLILFSLNGISQVPKNAAYIYSSTLAIGKIEIVERPKAKIFFREYARSTDTSENHKGDYKTIFTFREIGIISDKTIILKFDNPIDSCEFKCLTGTSRVNYSLNKQKTECKFVIGQIKADGFSFVIYSKEKIYTNIEDAEIERLTK